MRATRSITVRRPIEEVFRFLSDPGRLGAWDCPAAEPLWTSGSTIGIGSQFAYAVDWEGESQLVTAEVIAYEPPAQIGWLSYAGERREITRFTLERAASSTVIHLRRLRLDAGPGIEVAASEIDRLLVALRDALEQELENSGG